MPKAKGSPKTGGRLKGSPNKITQDMREMWIEAYEKSGGVDYLVGLAKSNPQVFAAGLIKMIPAKVEADITVEMRLSHLSETIESMDSDG